MPKYPYAITVRAKLMRLHRTQRDIAAALGYSPSYISMVLSGAYPSPAIRQKISALLQKWEKEP